MTPSTKLPAHDERHGLAMSTTISPLAPTHFPDMPPIAGVRLATAAAGIRYRAAPTCCSRCSIRARPSPASSRARNARPRRSTGAAPGSKAGARARAGGQFRQRQRLHRQDRPRGLTKLTAEIAAKAAGCKPAEVFLASTGVIGEPLDASQVRRRDGRPRRRRRARRLARRRQGDHDHRHLSEGRGRDGAARRDARSPSTASPRAPA